MKFFPVNEGDKRRWIALSVCLYKYQKIRLTVCFLLVSYCLVITQSRESFLSRYVIRYSRFCVFGSSYCAHYFSVDAEQSVTTLRSISDNDSGELKLNRSWNLGRNYHGAYSRKQREENLQRQRASRRCKRWLEKWRFHTNVAFIENGRGGYRVQWSEVFGARLPKR